MGRLRVWVPAFNSPEDDETGWIYVSYMSPFAGSTAEEYETSDFKLFDSTLRKVMVCGWFHPLKIQLVIVGFLRRRHQSWSYLWAVYIIRRKILQYPEYQVPTNYDGGTGPAAERNINDPQETILRPKHDPMTSALENSRIDI